MSRARCFLARDKNDKGFEPKLNNHGKALKGKNSLPSRNLVSVSMSPDRHAHRLFSPYSKELGAARQVRKTENFALRKTLETVGLSFSLPGQLTLGETARALQFSFV